MWISCSYKELAWGYDEMGPRTGFGNKNWGHIGMTLIDGLDTLYLMGFKEDVKKVRDWVVDCVGVDSRLRSILISTEIVIYLYLN